MTDTTLYLNGRIFTGAGSPPAEAVAVRGGMITAVGTTGEVSALLNDPVDVIDLNGHVVWPGLTDSHLHLGFLAEQLAAVDCETDSLAECLERVRLRAEGQPAGAWIIGYGWNHNIWDPPRYGDANALDTVTGDRPALLHAKSLHAAWVNSAALRFAGITAQTPNPEGGEILRDARGEPTGILLENAIGLVGGQLPGATANETADGLLLAQNYLLGMGLTGVHDFDRWESAEALLLLADRDKLRLRVVKNMPADSLDRLIREETRQVLNRPPYLFPGWVKLFADGALGPQSAAMLEPYEGTQTKGMLQLRTGEILEHGKLAAQGGWPLAIHAIGDLAVRETLDGFALLREYEERNDLPRLPHRIEHVQLISSQDQPRLGQLGIIASMQPYHATSDMRMADRHWGARSANSYANKALLDQGAFELFGSDAPVEVANPFFTLHAAVTRQDHQNQPAPDGWHPEQRLALAEALTAMTRNPASLLPEPSLTGCLQPGSAADMIVLQRDPFTMPSEDLWTLEPVMTIVAGRVVYSR